MKKIRNSLFMVLLMMISVMFMPAINAKAVNFNVYGLYNGIALTGSTITVDANEFNANSIFSPRGFAWLLSQDVIDAYFTLDGKKVETTRDNTIFSYVPQKADKNKQLRFEIVSTGKWNDYLPSGWQDLQTKSYPVARAVVNVDKPDSNGIMRITGKTREAGITFRNVRVDDIVIDSSLSSNDLNYEINTKEYSIGVHELSFDLSDYTKIGPILFPRNIKVAPKNSLSNVKTYSNLLMYTLDYSFDSVYGSVYVQVKKSNGDWKTYGPFSGYDKKKITGLTPSSTYQVRALYIKDFGKNTQLMGPYSNTVTVKTGKAKKPSIKSVKISNVKVKKRWISGKSWLDAGGVLHSTKGYYSYTTSYKITVNLKKKPGSKGIYIGSHKIKGNKKKYTLKVTESGKRKGKKVKISVMSYNNNTYGAYSAIATKKVKIK